MDLTNFKFSPDTKVDAIWKAVNPDFSKEEEVKIDKVPCEIGVDYAIVCTVEESKYERYAFVTKEDGTIEMAGEPEVVYTSWIRQEDVPDYDKLKSQYSKPAEIVEAFENLNNTISEKDNLISEKDAKIVELEGQKSTYESEANAAKDELQSKLDSLQADYDVLKEEHDTRVKEAKEAKVAEYEEMISDATLATIKEKMADFSMEELEKELLFAVKKEKPAMFSKEPAKPMAPAAILDDTGATGLVGILKKYTH